MKRVKDFFFANILLKILSLVFAIFVWLFIVNIDNPSQSRNFTTNVEVINENVLTDNGRYYTIPEGQNTVTFRVTAPRSVIEKLSSSDFSAIADMNNLEDDSRIPIDISAKNHTGSVAISSVLRYLNVEVGDEMTEKYIIAPTLIGDPARGFVVDSMSVAPNIVTVTGPDKIVSTIRQVQAVCDINGLSSDITENVIPVFLDGNGERVDTTKLDISVSDVSVNVVFTNIKEVPIMLEGLGTDAENSDKIEFITFDPSKVTIRGSSSILNDITEIVIPATVIDVDSIEENVSTTVDITRYLPEGVRLADGSQAEVKVDIGVYTEDERSIRIPTSSITVRNLSSGSSITFQEEELEIRVRGISAVIDSLLPDEITGSVDVSGLGEGMHTVRFVADEDDRYIVAPATVRITISERSGG